MKKTIIFFNSFILVYFIQLGVGCATDTAVSPQVVVTQDNIDPADMEVIENLDLLQNWDIIGPQGPDMNKLDILNTTPVKGATYDK